MVRHAITERKLLVEIGVRVRVEGRVVVGSPFVWLIHWFRGEGNILGIYRVQPGGHICDAGHGTHSNLKRSIRDDWRNDGASSDDPQGIRLESLPIAPVSVDTHLIK